MIKIKHKGCKFDWSIWHEYEWIVNMLAIHKETLKRFEVMEKEYRKKIERFENYLRTGK